MKQKKAEAIYNYVCWCLLVGALAWATRLLWIEIQTIWIRIPVTASFLAATFMTIVFADCERREMIKTWKK